MNNFSHHQQHGEPSTVTPAAAVDQQLRPDACAADPAIPNSAAPVPASVSASTSTSTIIAASSSASLLSQAQALPPPHALDGSQFHNVIDEQAWSELPPTPDEQRPHRIFHRADAADTAGSPNEEARISVGPV